MTLNMKQKEYYCASFLMPYRSVLEKMYLVVRTRLDFTVLDPSLKWLPIRKKTDFLYIKRQKHFHLMCLRYVCHVAVSQLFENEYIDVSRAENFIAKLYINVVTLYIILRFFNIKLICMVLRTIQRF